MAEPSIVNPDHGAETAAQIDKMFKENINTDEMSQADKDTIKALQEGILEVVKVAEAATAPLAEIATERMKMVEDAVEQHTKDLKAFQVYLEGQRRDIAEDLIATIRIANGEIPKDQIKDYVGKLQKVMDGKD